MADEKTPEQMQAEAEAARIAADNARADFLAPLRAIVDRPSFKSIMDDLNAVAPGYISEPVAFAHLHGVASIMPRLKEWLDGQPKHTAAD